MTASRPNPHPRPTFLRVPTLAEIQGDALARARVAAVARDAEAERRRRSEREAAADVAMQQRAYEQERRAAQRMGVEWKERA